MPRFTTTWFGLTCSGEVAELIQAFRNFRLTKSGFARTSHQSGPADFQ
jgi:hypothetical protein